MSQERALPYSEESHLTPWVGRIIMANAVVLLVLSTILTAPAFVDALQMAPALSPRRPWTFGSYMFVHTGLLHLAVNMLLLFVFGPPVERRMGGRAFALYYLYCGLGAAALGLGLSSFLAAPPMLGATGGVLGVAFAFAYAWPDAELVLFPNALRVSARTVVVMLAVVDLAFAVGADSGPAHVGFLGGIAAGYIFFRVQALATRRPDKEPRAVTRRPVMTPIPVRQGSPAVEVRPAIIRPEVRPEYTSDEVDRVLDKISASGLSSLTPDERRFLDEVSRKKRNDTP